MAERDGQFRDADVGVDVDPDVDVPGDPVEESAPAGTTTDGESRSRIRERAGNLLSGRSLALSLVFVTAGAVLAGLLLPLGGVGDLLGIVVAAFLYGLGTDSRRYLELAVAGALVGGASALLGNLVLSFVGVGLPVVAVGAGGGGLAAVVGHYFGRDLRDGLTRDL